MWEDHPIKKALDLPNGARFYRASLQVNPFEYLLRHSKETPFTDEASYNAAMVEACMDQGVEVIAVTDHYRINSAVRLIEAAEEAGIIVFRGFEAVSKDGVHMLCLFNPDKDIDAINRIIGDCGIHDDSDPSPLGKYDVCELLEECQKWGCACIAAHIAAKGGLLRTLSGQTGIQAWTSNFLVACSLPGPVTDAPDNHRPIIQNKNGDYRKERPIAVLNAQDVSGPDDFKRPGAWCYMKMSEVSVEGLRQTFLDPRSRIRLVSDPVPEEHEEFVALTWQGGFLSGTSVNLNQNLNVLIGGRGAGKSTIVESIRHVLDLNPLGGEATKNHKDIVNQVLKSGTKISLLVRSYRPSCREYLIERTIPNPPVVRDQYGNDMDVSPIDIVRGAEVYGQHEISELTKSPEKLTLLLERFIKRDPSMERKKADLVEKLKSSRQDIIKTIHAIQSIEDRLSRLPALEETLNRYKEAGLEDKLGEQSLLVREETVLETAYNSIEPFQGLKDELDELLPVDTSFLNPDDIKDLPAQKILSPAKQVLDKFSEDLQKIATSLEAAIETAGKGLEPIKAKWNEHRVRVNEDYEKILRDLQKEKIDGAEFIQLKKQIGQLSPLKGKMKKLKQSITQLLKDRRSLLVSWEDAKNDEFQTLEKAAKKVSRQLAGRVKVQVSPAGSLEFLFQFLKNKIGGRLFETIDALKKRVAFSLVEFAMACQSGKDDLVKKFGLPPSQAERLAETDPDIQFQMEELDLPTTTTLKLNVAAEGQDAHWQELSQLSTGQKATAVLLLLLLESDAPLVVDQPEDDLDNRFITDSVVPKMRDEKRRRQFIFSTHNANIPVLGDAELILGLVPSADSGHEHADIPEDRIGSIDSEPVREMVEELLEGGKQAFEMRRLKYGF
ncbi:MAG: PHP domain-containing protein [Anaerolineaceae bacterium]|nr:PHP domain-containing protein [Anaerolineaceae bacterium]